MVCSNELENSQVTLSHKFLLSDKEENLDYLKLFLKRRRQNKI